MSEIGVGLLAIVAIVIGFFMGLLAAEWADARREGRNDD